MNAKLHLGVGYSAQPNSLGNAEGISTDTSTRRIDRNLCDLAYLNFADPPTATDAVWGNLIERGRRISTHAELREQEEQDRRGLQVYRARHG